MTMKNVLNILLVEDNMIEIMKIRRTITLLNLNHKVIEAKNAEEALLLLQNSSIIPDIILLDLNMPKISGIEFLSVLKSCKKLSYIPTIILTTSNNQKDILECYRLGISGYILKPLKFDDYVDKIEATLSYWCHNEFIISKS